jgi:hypothetical protein
VLEVDFEVDVPASTPPGTIVLVALLLAGLTLADALRRRHAHAA